MQSWISATQECFCSESMVSRMYSAPFSTCSNVGECQAVPGSCHPLPGKAHSTTQPAPALHLLLLNTSAAEQQRDAEGRPTEMLWCVRG